MIHRNSRVEWLGDLGKSPPEAIAMHIANTGKHHDEYQGTSFS